ncbi:MAG: DNA-directed RNA polymerase subunit alpha [Clostridia bacterium]|nr:DNA-directed RNA polymerase subunit alpha [Clostridia bacterium]
MKNYTYDCLKIAQPEVKITDVSEKEGTLEVYPLVKGFGMTLGNALRRVMIGSLAGSAPLSVYVEINGKPALHEFSEWEGVKEDLCDSILNVKSLVTQVFSSDTESVVIDVVGAKTVTGADLSGNANVNVINKDAVIANVGEGVRFYMEIKFLNGVGYFSAQDNGERYEKKTGEIFVDSIFSPAVNVAFSVADYFSKGVGYEKLHVDVKTDGSILPSEAVKMSARILKTYFGLIPTDGEDDGLEVKTFALNGEKNTDVDKKIEDLNLSVRSFNCLKRSRINTVADLILLTENDLKKIRNMGAKSVTEIIEKLTSLKLKLKEEE